MTRNPIKILLALATVMATAGSAHAANLIIYAQGRGQADWSTKERVNTPTGSSWTNITVPYDGGASINGPATTTLRTKLEEKCAVGKGNTCIVVCYSAGCLRLLRALHTSSVTSFVITRVSAIASAAGGTKIATSVTTGSLKSVAKLIGQQEAVDWDLTPGVARGTYAQEQNAMNKTTGTMYHYAGYLDVCQSFLFVKMCGNKYVNAGLTGAKGDGLVSFDSAGGSSAQGAFNNICSAGGTGTKRITSRYPKRVPAGACDGEARNHMGMPGLGVKYTEEALLVTPTGDANLTYGTSTSQAVCSDADTTCGQRFTSTATDPATLTNSSNQPVTVAPSTNATSSNSTFDTSSTLSCAGRCGLYEPERACQCDASCGSGGDCCADYAASNCANVKVW